MTIPKEVKNIIARLEKAGFEAYIVGGCSRDFLQDKEPNDWDVTTSAKPEQIQKLFPDNFYENRFLTVTVQTKSKTPRLKEIEVTTFRSEAKYADKRHPDQVQFAQTLEEDLNRRDFTINAIAIGLKSQLPSSKSQKSPKPQIPNTKYKILNTGYTVIDPFDGQEDLKSKIIRAVGNAADRFQEDALRLLRAVRLATVLDFRIETGTRKAIVENSRLLKHVSAERIRDEFVKIILSERAGQGIELLRELGLLIYVVPELQEGRGVSQNKHHIYDCYRHNLLSLEFAAKKNFGLEVRLASLFHDIAKPRVKKGEGPNATFYGHEIVGARMTDKILERLKFPVDQREKIVRLVRYHLFYYNVGEVGENSIRRLVRNVGPENMEELLKVRMADRIGSGVPKAEPYKLRHLRFLIEKASREPLTAKLLKIDGNDVMGILGIGPGPKVGQILDVLLGEVLNDPKQNKKDFLKKETKRLAVLPEQDLAGLAAKAREEREMIEQKKDEMTKEKYWVT